MQWMDGFFRRCIKTMFHLAKLRCVLPSPVFPSVYRPPTHRILTSAMYDPSRWNDSRWAVLQLRGPSESAPSSLPVL